MGFMQRLRWEKYLKVQDICFVADRAMFTRENLALLDASGYRYIIAAKLRGLKQEVKDKILDESSYFPMALGTQFAWVSDISYEGKRLITSYKSSRAKNDAKSRQRIVEKIEKQIGNKGSTKKLISNTGIKRYTTTNKSTTVLDHDKIAQDALWDGLHGVITNDKDISVSEAIAMYARLWVIEESFRLNKHNLKMRPIYHWTPKRIESHIALCYMSFTLLRQLEYRVELTQKISAKEIVNILLGVQTSIHQHKKTKDLYRVPGVFKKDAQKIYKCFNLTRKRDAEIYFK